MAKFMALGILMIWSLPGRGGGRTKSNNVLSELANGLKFGVDAAGHGQNLERGYA